MVKNVPGESNGTGSFIAPNIVLTARHVVSKTIKVEGSPRSYESLPCENFALSFGDYTDNLPGVSDVTVKAIELYTPRGDDRYEDIALLILSDPVLSYSADVCPSLSVLRKHACEKAITSTCSISNSEINTKFTVTGFGQGGLIQLPFDTDCKEIDLLEIIGDHNTFRFYDNISMINTHISTGIGHTHTLNVGSLNMKVGAGDSGGPLLNSEFQIVGVNISGAISSSATSLDNARNDIWCVTDDGNTLTAPLRGIGRIFSKIPLLNRTTELSNTLNKYNTHRIFERRMRTPYQNILNALENLKEGDLGGLGSSFLVFDEALLQWIEEVKTAHPA